MQRRSFWRSCASFSLLVVRRCKFTASAAFSFKLFSRRIQTPYASILMQIQNCSSEGPKNLHCFYNNSKAWPQFNGSSVTPNITMHKTMMTGTLESFVLTFTPSLGESTCITAMLCWAALLACTPPRHTVNTHCRVLAEDYLFSRQYIIVVS